MMTRLSYHRTFVYRFFTRKGFFRSVNDLRQISHLTIDTNTKR